MDEDDQLLHRYAASLNDDNGNPIGFTRAVIPLSTQFAT
jgi:hypothetical protein